MVASYFWKDGKDYFATSIAHLRQMQNSPRPIHHSALQKWQDRRNWNGNLEALWRETLHNSRSQAKNVYLWQMIYGIPTTLVYKDHRIPVNDLRMHCTRCTLLVLERIEHTIYECLASREIWKWVALLITLPPPMPTFHITITQVFLADAIHLAIPLGIFLAHPL